MFTRRQVMASTGQIFVAVGATVLPVACMKQIEQPWSDGTFWDDGTGWVG